MFQYYFSSPVANLYGTPFLHCPPSKKIREDNSHARASNIPLFHISKDKTKFNFTLSLENICLCKNLQVGVEL